MSEGFVADGTPSASPPGEAGPSPTEIAARLWRDDAATRSLGIELVSAGRGTARCAMTVRADMLNGHGTAHGGFLAAFADSAFAVACNSYGEATVASAFTVEFLAPARLGDRLVAEAGEVARNGRNGVYDVTVRRGGTVIATFRGRSRSLGRPVSG